MMDNNEIDAGPLSAMTASWAASLDAMSAWSQTWQAFLEKRSSPASQLVRDAAGNPSAWPQAVMPIIDEMQRALALPRFADLPRLDETLMPSAGAAIDATLLVQQYVAAAMPAWAKACATFQKEIAERRAKGETVDVNNGLDIWNGVLDRTLMEFNRSGEFGELQKRLLRLTMQQRQAFRKRAEGVAEVFDMPTRTEMLDVYHRLHALMREVHVLRTEVRALKSQKSRKSQSDT